MFYFNFDKWPNSVPSFVPYDLFFEAKKRRKIHRKGMQKKLSKHYIQPPFTIQNPPKQQYVG